MQPAAKRRRAQPRYTTDTTRLSGDTRLPPAWGAHLQECFHSCRSQLIFSLTLSVFLKLWLHRNFKQRCQERCSDNRWLRFGRSKMDPGTSVASSIASAEEQAGLMEASATSHVAHARRFLHGPQAQTNSMRGFYEFELFLWRFTGRLADS